MHYPINIPGNTLPAPQTVGRVTTGEAALWGAGILGLLGAGIALYAFVIYFWRSKVKAKLRAQLLFIQDIQKTEGVSPEDMAEGLAGLLGNYADTKVWAWTDASRLEWARDQIGIIADEIGLDIPKKVWLLAGTKAMAYMQRADIAGWGAATYAGVWLRKKAKKKAAKKKTKKKATKKKAKKTSKKRRTKKARQKTKS